MIAYLDTSDHYGNRPARNRYYDTTSPTNSTWSSWDDDDGYTYTYFGQRSEPEEKPAPLPFAAAVRARIRAEFTTICPPPVRIVAKPRRILVPQRYQCYSNKQCWTAKNFHKEN